MFPKADLFESPTLTLNATQEASIEAQLGWDISVLSYDIHSAYLKGELLGHALVLDELGKYFPITFLTAATPDFQVKEAVVMIYREKIGSEVRKKRFLKQFIGKDKEEDFMLNLDVDGITGATVSSWSISSGIKKALYLMETLIETGPSDKDPR